MMQEDVTRLSKDRTYTVLLQGGLGNQMFQYALGRSLSLRHRARLLLDVRSFAANPGRHFALNEFAISAKVADVSELESNRPDAPITRLAKRIIRRFLNLNVDHSREQGFSFDPLVMDLNPPATLVGFWQSERYFRPYSDAIRKDFTLSENLTRDRMDIARLIKTTNAVSVHVRRGDYLTNTFHGTCSPEWYLAADAVMRDKVKDHVYVVFADDPVWAHANLTKFEGALYVAPSPDGRDAQDMYLMSLCKHHIIANSTFSWWGAWLNPRPDKVVVAPAKWFAGAPFETPDILPEGWLRL